MMTYQAGRVRTKPAKTGEDKYTYYGRKVDLDSGTPGKIISIRELSRVCRVPMSVLRKDIEERFSTEAPGTMGVDITDYVRTHGRDARRKAIHAKRAAMGNPVATTKFERSQKARAAWQRRIEKAFEAIPPRAADSPEE